MVQPSRRSYFYFISFAKKKGIACVPRQGSVFARVRRVYKPLAPRPDWDNTIHDLSVLKLSPKELEARKIAYRTLPEHRIRRSISSATATLPTSDAAGADARTLTTSSATGISAITAAEVAIAGSRRNDSKKCSRSCRVGKENSSSALATVETTLHQQPLPSKRRERKLVAAALVKTKATRKCVRTPIEPLQPANSLASPSSGSGADESLPFRCQTVAQETEFEGNQKLCCARPTVDFEKEVKQFEVRAEFLVRSVKPLLKGSLSLGADRRLNSIRPSYTLAKKVRIPNFCSVERMDKSESSDDDSSLSGAWGEPITRFQKFGQPIPEHHHHHRKNYSRKGEEVAGVVGSVVDARQDSKYPQRERQPQKEIVYYKQTADPPLKPRTKLSKRHFGSIQRTSPIEDWKVNVEDGATEHLALQQIADFQRHILRCQQELMLEFKDFKISISKQIMNLQLDVDVMLELQKKQDSLPAEIRAPSCHGTGNGSPIAGVEKVVLPTYSSMKVKKDDKRPESVSPEVAASAEENPHMQTYNGYNGPEYDRSRKSTRPHHGSEARCRPSSAPAAAAPQVFDNPIYHVQTSSDKEVESSDEDASISSVELTNFLASRSAHQTDANGREYVLSKEPTLANQGKNSTTGIRQVGIEETKSYSLVPYGHPQDQEAEPSPSAERDNPEDSYIENRADSNGHAGADSTKLGKSNEQNFKQSFHHYQTEDTRPVTKNGTPPSPSIGTYRSIPIETAEEDPIIPRDLELRLGSSAVNSGMASTVNSSRSSPKDHRNRLSPSVSRTLFTAGTSNSGSNSPAVLTNVKDCHRLQDIHDRERLEVARVWQNGRSSKPAEMADDKELPFTLRGWSASFLRTTDNVQKGHQPALTGEIKEEPVLTTRTSELPKSEMPRETSKSAMKFPGRCSKGGVAWTVTGPPASAKKVRNSYAD
ncbi:hypothetical protein R1flu_015825 [Riccia fluitans]|uniref:Uncharacterized protein n=1 Tax=Riccia fluitans TaxID=41844 RepID=A0ABD1YL37_9MARC